MAIDKGYSLRLANFRDKDIIFSWANDDLVRKWSFNQDYIKPAEHDAWFKKIKDLNTIIYIFEFLGKPNGLVRFEKNNDHVVLNYLIAPSARGKGFGAKMLSKALLEIRKVWNGLEIFAYTFPNNIASIKSLEKSNFLLVNKSENKYCFSYSK